MSERRRLPRCTAHGLAYDPATSPGCVLCRNSKPPVASASVPAGRPTLGVTHPRPYVADSSSKGLGLGLDGWTLVRLVFGVLLMATLVVFSMMETSGVVLGYHFGMGAGMSLVAALFCLPISRFRNLRSFSKLALVLNLVGVVGQLPALAKGGSGPMVDRRAPAGNLTLRVPKAWHFENATGPDSLPRSLLVAGDGTTFAWTMEKESDFAPGLTIADYGELMRKVYTVRLNGNFGQGEAALLGGTPALRFEIEGARDSARVKGYLYVAKGRQDFCHVLVLAPPSRFEALQELVGRVMETAVVE